MCHDRYEKFIKYAYVQHYNIKYIISIFFSLYNNITMHWIIMWSKQTRSMESHKYIIQDVKRLLIHFFFCEEGGLCGLYGYHLITGLIVIIFFF